MKRFMEPYRNIYREANPNLKSVLKWQFGFIDEPYALFDGSEFAYKPEHITPDFKRIQSPNNADSIQITWIGHATFLIQIGGINILTDPHFSKRASPVQWFGPKRVAGPALAVKDLPEIDIVVISHNHYDHLDRNTVKKLGNKPHYFVPAGVDRWFSKLNITNVSELSWGEANTHKTLKATSVPVQHFSGRTLNDKNRTQWAGWVLEIGERKIFFAGDTGYAKEYFTDIYEKFGAIDLSLIPIGAYHPRTIMDNVHVDPREAVMIHQDVGSKKSIGMHWGTFRLTTEPMNEPPEYLKYALKEAGIAEEEFIVLKFGETAFI